jgi:hypothetical protein
MSFSEEDFITAHEKWSLPRRSRTRVFLPILISACLSGAVVEKAQFGANLGLTEEMKLDLKRRGAIFQDSPSDRSGVRQKVYTNMI